MVFFALSGQLQQMLGASLHENGHVFLLSALASQVMSNVPAALLLSHFTENWQALLWGVNAGGYGTLIASFANLIAWRAFMQHGPDTAAKWLFTLRLSSGGAVMLLASSALYYILY
jgi:Na+/H+ antiporter NhaD/arsenite permease-like protein